MSEDMILKHCSPTLAGIKTANLFSCEYESPEKLYSEVRELNKRLTSKGLRVLPLKKKGKRALIYVYRPNRLKNDLNDKKARSQLCKCGYCVENTEICIAQLCRRLKECDTFPHEIGFFLGYPPEDVIGFMENKAANAKYVGCWKVYGDVQKAKKTFMIYEKCTSIYYAQWQSGKSIERLTVAG